jgi:hypothetical protein
MEAQPFAPTGKQLAELARAAKCHADVFKDGAGKDALAAIIVAALASTPTTVTAGIPKPEHSPGACWKCGAVDQWETQAQGTQTIRRCTGCGSKYITPRF